MFLTNGIALASLPTMDPSAIGPLPCSATSSTSRPQDLVGGRPGLSQSCRASCRGCLHKPGQLLYPQSAVYGLQQYSVSSRRCWARCPTLTQRLALPIGPLRHRSWPSLRRCWREAGQRAHGETTWERCAVSSRSASTHVFPHGLSSRWTRPSYVRLQPTVSGGHWDWLPGTIWPASRHGTRSGTPHTQTAFASSKSSRALSGLALRHLTSLSDLPLPSTSSVPSATPWTRCRRSTTRC
jgi:hypothetical protein